MAHLRLILYCFIALLCLAAASPKHTIGYEDFKVAFDSVIESESGFEPGDFEKWKSNPPENADDSISRPEHMSDRLIRFGSAALDAHLHVYDTSSVDPEYFGSSQATFTIWPDDYSFFKFDIYEGFEDCEVSLQDLDGRFLVALGQHLKTVESASSTFLAIEGTISAGDRCDDWLTFTSKLAPYGAYKPSGDGHNIKDGLSMILDAKTQIIAATNPSDLLLFIGNSAGYIYHAFGEQDSRNVHLIPYSRTSSISTVRIDALREGASQRQDLFIQRILEPVLASRPRRSGRVIMIDFAQTGQSFSDMAFLLASTEQLRVVGLGGGTLYEPVWALQLTNQNIPSIITDGSYVMLHEAIQVGRRLSGDVLLLGNALWGRIVPPYPNQYWYIEPDDVGFPEKELASRMIDEIQQAR